MFIKSFLKVGFFKFINILLTLLLSILLARFLGADDYGIYSFIGALIPILALPITAGLSNLIIREVSIYKYYNLYDKLNGIIRFSFIYVFFGSSLLILLFLILSDLFADYQYFYYIFISIFCIPFISIDSIRYGFCVGIKKPIFAQLPDLLIRQVILVFIIILYISYGVLSLSLLVKTQFFIFLFIGILSVIFLYIFYPKKCGKIKKYNFKKWINSLISLSLSSILIVLNSQLSVLMLGFLGSGEQVAAIKISEKGAQLVAIYTLIVNVIMSPYFVELFNDKKILILEKKAKYSARIAFLLSFISALFLFLWGKEIISFVYGYEYGDLAYRPLCILLFGQIIMVSFGVVENLLAMCNFEREIILPQIISFSTNLILSILLIPKIGVVGAAIASSMSIIIWSGMLWYKVKLKIKINASIF